MERDETSPVGNLVDEGSFEPARDDLRPTDPLGFPGYAELAPMEAKDADTDESVVYGNATIGGHAVEVAAFSFPFFGGSMGQVAGERLARSMERASSRSVPFVLRVASGGARMQEGMAALVQMPKVVAARLALAENHMPFIAVLGDPTTGGVFASIASLADVTVAEAGATIGFAGPRVVEMMTGTAPGAGSHNAATALGNGLVDDVVEVDDVHAALERILNVLRPDEAEAVVAPPRTEASAAIDGWTAVETVRSPDRVAAPALATALCAEFVPLRGDRAGTSDESLVVRMGRLRGRRVLMIATDRAELIGPGGYRLARRALRVAERIQIPVVTLIDTRGADPAEESEAGGIASEIAQLFAAMLTTEVPIVACLTGEGGSGGALAFATGDVLVAYDDAIFSVIGPEAAATILWRDASRAAEAARALKLTASDLHAFGIADALLPGPPEAVSLGEALAYHLDRIEWTSGHDLVVARANRWRNRDGHGQTSS